MFTVELQASLTAVSIGTSTPRIKLSPKRVPLPGNLWSNN